MAKRKSTLTEESLGLGEGAPRLSLGALFAAGASRDTEMQHPIMVAIEHLLDNPYQPRLEKDDTSLEELAQVIGQQGFQGVLVARRNRNRADRYELTAGHRRREAAKLAGLSVLPIVVQDLTDEEMVVRAITENIQREDLTTLEEGRVFLLMQEEMGYTLKQIAKEVGKSVGYIRNRLRVAGAPPDVQKMVEERPDTLLAATYLISVPSVEARQEVIGHILAGTLPVADVPGYIEALQVRYSSEASGSEVVTSVPEMSSGPGGGQGSGPDISNSPVIEPAVQPSLSVLAEVNEVPRSTEPAVVGVGAILHDTLAKEATATRADDAGDNDTDHPVLVPKAVGSGSFLVIPQEPKQSANAPAPSGRSAQAQSQSPSRQVPYEPYLPEIQGLFRLRRAKLASALRALLAYKGSVQSGENLPKEEIEYLSRIEGLLKELRGQSR